MIRPISEVAADPKQYDQPAVRWAEEGNIRNPNRQLFLDYLDPYLSGASGRTALDIGSGQGWLLGVLTEHGAHPTGIEPSAKNAAVSARLFPDAPVERTSLQEFSTKVRFDRIFAIMVLEHFRDLAAAYRKIASLLAPDGSFVTIVGDYDKFCYPQSGYRSLTREEIAPGETAVRIDYGADRHGVVCDIHRTVERHRMLAEEGGLIVAQHTPITPTPDHPRYATHQDRPIFHMLELTKA